MARCRSTFPRGGLSRGRCRRYAGSVPRCHRRVSQRTIGTPFRNKDSHFLRKSGRCLGLFRRMADNRSAVVSLRQL